MGPLQNLTSVSRCSMFSSCREVKNEIWQVVSDCFRAIGRFFQNLYNGVKNILFPKKITPPTPTQNQPPQVGSLPVKGNPLQKDEGISDSNARSPSTSPSVSPSVGAQNAVPVAKTQIPDVIQVQAILDKQKTELFKRSDLKDEGISDPNARSPSTSPSVSSSVGAQNAVPVAKTQTPEGIQIQAILDKQEKKSLDNQDIIDLTELFKRSDLNEAEKSRYWAGVKKVKIDESNVANVVCILSSLGDNNRIEELKLYDVLEVPGIEQCIPHKTIRQLILIDSYGGLGNATPLSFALQNMVANCTSLSLLHLQGVDCGSLQFPKSLREFHIDCKRTSVDFFGNLEKLPYLAQFHSYGLLQISYDHIKPFASKLTHFSGRFDSFDPSVACLFSDKLRSFCLDFIDEENPISRGLNVLADRAPSLENLELAYNRPNMHTLTTKISDRFKNLQSLSLRNTHLPEGFFESMPKTLTQLTLSAVRTDDYSLDLEPLQHLPYLTRFAFHCGAGRDADNIKKWPPHLTHLELCFGGIVNSDFVVEFFSRVPLPDHLQSLDLSPYRHRKLLHCFAEKPGNAKIIQFLIEKGGFSVNETQKEHCTLDHLAGTPLDVACRTPNNEETIKILTRLGGERSS